MMRTATPHVLKHYAEEAGTVKKGHFLASLIPLVLVLIGFVGLWLMLSADGRAL